MDKEIRKSVGKYQKRRNGSDATMKAKKIASNINLHGNALITPQNIKT